MGNKVIINFSISIDADMISESLEDSWNKLINDFGNKLIESTKSKKTKSGKTNYLNSVLKPQLEKVDLDTTLTYKLVLSTKGINEAMFEDIILKSYRKLTKEGLIEGKKKDYHTIFTIEEPLNRQVRWLGTRKELKYLVCKLSGKDFTEQTSESKKKYNCTLKGRGEKNTVFYSNTWIFEKAANSFLNSEGKRFIPKSIQINNEVTPITPAKKQFLGEVAMVFTNE
ncbi:MAG: hypothetical protein HYU68_00430 [Bacteroidetes bacterium]|nr:hypothetical protein [Bacteroidota bacterium]